MPETFRDRLALYFDLRTSIFGRNRAEIIDKLGKPVETTVERIRNRHQSDITDEIIRMLYDGLSVTIYKANYAPGKEFVWDMTVTSPRFKMPWGIDVGCSRDLVRQTLGPPTRVKDAVESYDVVYFPEGPGYINSLSFTYRDDRVSAIYFWLYID